MSDDLVETEEEFPPSKVWTLMEFHAGLCSESELGRPKPPVIHARRLAQHATPLAIKALIDVAEQQGDLPAKVKAAQAILDRGWGKPEVTQVNINPPEREWPSWLTSRRLAYQESSRYAEDIVPLELQGRPREVLEAVEVPAPAPAPAPPPVTFDPMKYDLGGKGHIAPVYTGYAKSQPLQAPSIPPENKVPTWTPPEPDPYDETPPLIRAMRTPEQLVEQAWERAQQAQVRITELEQALEREQTPELEQAYRQAVEEGLVAQRAYTRERERIERERDEREPAKNKTESSGGGPFKKAGTRRGGGR